MSSTADILLSILPPFQGNAKVISPDQDVKDIVAEVLRAHKIFSSHYDQIADFFPADSSVYKELFKFCKDLPYLIESEKHQTTRSPAGILALADSKGVDCKHYAGFVGGILDAQNRAGLTNHDWNYRFASYDQNENPEHVYIVVYPTEGKKEIWIDPAPVASSGSLLTRSYNDRLVIPTFYIDKKIKPMLQRLSGASLGNSYPDDQGIIGFPVDVKGTFPYAAGELVSPLYGAYAEKPPIYTNEGVRIIGDDRLRFGDYQKRADLMAWANSVQDATERAEYVERVNSIDYTDVDAMHSLVTYYFIENIPVPGDLQRVWDKYFDWSRPPLPPAGETVKTPAEVFPGADPVPGQIVPPPVWPSPVGELPLNSDFTLIDAYLKKAVAFASGKGWKNFSYAPALYLASGLPVKFSLPTYGAELPPQDLQVIYPSSWQGVSVPAELPRPVVVGSRLVLLPKPVNWDLIKANGEWWAGYLASVMLPLVLSYAKNPLKEYFDPSNGDYSWLQHYIKYDQDRSDIVDYITNTPTIIPLTAGLPSGVEYLVNGLPLVWPPDRTDLGFTSIDQYRGSFPPPLPVIDVVYPAVYLGVPMPAGMPKPVVKDGKLQISPKGFDWNILKANNYFWLSFLSSVVAPIINAYAQYPYANNGSQLSDRILYDQDTKDEILNYLDPGEVKTFFGEVGEIVSDVGRVLAKFLNAGSRLAFAGLVRINGFAFAYKLFYNYNDPSGLKRERMEQLWENLGGNSGDLRSMVKLGCRNNPILGGGVKQWIEDAVRAGALDTPNIVFTTKPPGDEFPVSQEGTPSELAAPIPPEADQVTLISGIGCNTREGAFMGCVYDAGLECYVLAACAVIVALAPILKGDGGGKDPAVDSSEDLMKKMLQDAANDPLLSGAENNAPVVVTDPVTGEKTVIYPPGAKTAGGAWDWVKAHPLAVGGGVAAVGLGVYALTNTKPKRKTTV